MSSSNKYEGYYFNNKELDFNSEGHRALEQAQKNIEHRRNSRKPLVVKPWGNYGDPEGKNFERLYNYFTKIGNKHDNRFTNAYRQEILRKGNKYFKNDPIINRYELYGKQYDQKIFENPRYKIDTSDHGRDYLNFDGEQVHFDIHGNPISQEEINEARSALSSLKKKYAKKTTKPATKMVKYNNYIDDDLSTNYSNDSIFDDYDWKDMSNEIPKDNEYSIDKDDIDLGF